jgi:hypothetical protein
MLYGAPAMRARFAWILPGVLLLACSGKTVEVAPDGGGASGDAGSCVNVDLSTFDRSCKQASDCVSVTAGELCTGQCSCGGSFINADGLARYQQLVAGVEPGTCFCGEEPAPECIDGTCSVGTAIGGDDAGTTSVADSGVCVDIDPSKYPDSCSDDSDCVDVTTGMICTGGCACGGTAMSKSGLTEYQQATQGVQTGECPCPSGGMPRCVQNECILCPSLGSNAPGCPDGG